jgi:hypothetical protein
MGDAPCDRPPEAAAGGAAHHGEDAREGAQEPPCRAADAAQGVATGAPAAAGRPASPRPVAGPGAGAGTAAAAEDRELRRDVLLIIFRDLEIEHLAHVLLVCWHWRRAALDPGLPVWATLNLETFRKLCPEAEAEARPPARPPTKTRVFVKRTGDAAASPRRAPPRRRPAAPPPRRPSAPPCPPRVARAGQMLSPRARSRRAGAREPRRPPVVAARAAAPARGARRAHSAAPPCPARPSGTILAI